MNLLLISQEELLRYRIGTFLTTKSKPNLPFQKCWLSPFASTEAAWPFEFFHRSAFLIQHPHPSSLPFQKVYPTALPIWLCTHLPVIFHSGQWYLCQSIWVPVYDRRATFRPLGKFGAKNKLLELSKAEDLKGWSDDISDQNVSTWLSLLRLPWNYCTRQMINCSNCVSSIPGAMALQLQSSRCSSCHFHNQMIGGQAERYYQLVHWSKYGDKTYTYCNIFKSKVICHLPLMYTITLWQQKTWTTYLLSGVASQRRWNIG